MITPRYGILSDGRLTTSLASIEVETSGLRSIAALVDLAKSCKIRQVWVLPGSEVYEAAKRAPRGFYAQIGTNGGELKIFPEAPDLVSNRQEIKLTLNDLITAWRNNDRVQILFPGIHEAMPGRPESQWSLDQIADAEKLRAALDALIGVLWVSPSVPNRTARLIFETTINKKYLKEGNGQDLRPFTDHKAQDLIYSRKLKAGEKKLKYLHVYDKNNAYLSAAGAKVGVGNYELIKSTKEYQLLFNSKIPGLYRVEDLSGDNLPKIKGGWFYSPELNFYKSINYLIRVREAYIFSEAYPVFEDFYKSIKSALEKLNELNIDPEIKKICRRSIKALYTKFFGWLNRIDYDPDYLDYYKPHWTFFIKSTAKARMLFNIHEIKKLGIEPVAVLTDAVWFLSDEPDASKAIPYPFTGCNPRNNAPTIYKSKTYPAAEVIPYFVEGKAIIHINRILKGKENE